MKRYDVLGTDSYVEERQSGDYVEYEDTARIIAQRDRLAEAVRELLAHESDDCQCGFVYRGQDVDDLREALAELDKEKQS